MKKRHSAEQIVAMLPAGHHDSGDRELPSFGATPAGRVELALNIISIP